MSIELKPCPFCGSDSITNHDTLIGYSVGCDKCGAVAAHCATKAESISAWNTRTAIQQAESEPVLFVSPKQARAVTGKNRVHYTPSDNSGRYLPVRATPAGLFVQPLYTHPAPGVPDGWSIEEKCGDLIVRKNGFGGYSARKNTESIAEAVLHELALDLLAASHAQKG